MVPRILLIYLFVLASMPAWSQPDFADARYHLRLGNDHLSRFEPVEALENFNRAITISNRYRDEFMKGRAYLGAGQAIWYQSRFEGAIDTLSTAIGLLKKRSDRDAKAMLASAYRMLSNIYDETGNFEKAFQATSESLALQVVDYRQNTMLCFVQLAELYLNIGDYATSREFFEKAERLHPESGLYEFRELNTQYGRFYATKGLYDSALYRYRRSIPGHPIPRNVHLRIGECYLLQKKYDSARHYLTDVVSGARNAGDIPILLPAMIGLSETLMHTDRPDSALVLASAALELATRKGKKQNKRDALYLLSLLHEKNGRPDQALGYYRQYVQLKDSVLSDQFKGRLYAFRKQEEDSKVLSEMELLKSNERVLKGSIMALVAVSILVILIVVLRFKNRNLDLRRRSSELEMQALRAQMNPHFIFNCMSAINHFILNKETDKASNYLTRFSRLIRLVLVNSEKNTITLEEELAMLRIYLDMEQLRFADAFEYRVTYDNDIHPSEVKVPSFVLQPFCENAIWHGMLHKEGPGLLTIDFKRNGDMITCTITDNGIGLTRAAEFKKRKTEEHTPFGHRLAAERLTLFNKGKQQAASFIIEDVKDEQGHIAGTRVIFSFVNED